MALPAQTLASHLVAQTISSVSLLESLQLISPADANLIRAKLPNPYGAMPSLVMSPGATPAASATDISSNMSSLSVSAGPARGPSPLPGPSYAPPGGSAAGVPTLPPRSRPEVRARALWDYHGTVSLMNVCDYDLAFRQGDTIIIDEEVNEQWFRGRVIPSGQQYPHDRSGLFPSNYVEKMPPQSFHQPPPPPPIGNAAMVPYQAPYDGKNSQSAMVVQPPPQPQVQQVTVVQQEEPKKGRFGKYGSQLGNAAVNGAGFGFGASVASNLVNAIL